MTRRRSRAEPGASTSTSASRALVQRVRTTLRERQLLRPSERVLVACSGGPDSQALLHVLHALRDEHGCALSVASVDHGLRPEAPAELALACSLAQRLGLPFVSLRVQVPAGPSLQAQARRVRYEALLACAAEQHASALAVGHTLDDQAETVLARILRGTGIEGLRGVEPRRADGVVRPLLDATRALVHDYVCEQGLEVAHDPSNDDPRFLRVRIRRELLPLLRRESPRAAEALAQLADDARESAYALASLVDGLLAQARAAPDGSAILRGAPQSLRRRALRRWAELESGAQLRRQHIVALERMLSVGGEVRLPGGVLAGLDAAGRLTFAPILKRGRGGSRLIEEPEEGP